MIEDQPEPSRPDYLDPLPRPKPIPISTVRRKPAASCEPRTKPTSRTA